MDFGLLKTLCSFLSLHRFEFRNVPQSRLQSQDLADPQQVQGFALSTMSSRISHALITFLRKKCVDVTLLSISCSFLPLHCLAFSHSRQFRFQSRDLADPQQVQDFALSKKFSRVSHV